MQRKIHNLMIKHVKERHIGDTSNKPNIGIINYQKDSNYRNGNNKEIIGKKC